MKMWKSVLPAALAVVFSFASLLLAAPSAHAQSVERGEIRGVVYDSSHSFVPGAKVTISNASTGYKREVTTDSDGLYDFAQLMPGVYKIEADAEGFAATVVTDVHVEIGSSLGLDITLPVKGQTQTVTVSASATGPVDTSTAGINQVINERNLETLPLSGRDYRDLAQLSSSAQVVPGLRGGIRLGGQQSDYLGIVVDGQDTFNNYFGEIFGSLETKNFTVPLEAVQEFQVVTNGFAPEFGRATGGLVNVVTKSGTNELHGEAHDYYRGSNFTADDAVGEPPNISTQNQFGGSVGFPIHKDRQFLFLAADTQLEHGPLVTQFCPPGAGQSTCLSALASATGPAFANCAPGACASGTVPLPANLPAGVMLPPGCGASPTAGELVLQDCYGVSSLAGFQGAHTQYQNLFTILGHYDYQFTPANHFSIRSYFTRNHTDGFSGAQGQNEIPQAFDNTENFINKGGAVTFSLNTVLGRKVNEIRLSLSDEVRERHSNSDSPGLSISDGSIPDLAVGSAFNYGIGQRYYLPINNQDGKLEAADNFSYSFGKHDIKFGGDSVTFEDRKDSFVGWGAGEYDYFSIAAFNNGIATGAGGCIDPTVTPTAFNCLLSQGVALNGKPLSFKGPATTLFPNYQSDLGLYWQDKWQLTPHLTVTYGLRWDGTWNPQPQTPLYGNTVLVGDGGGTHDSAVPQRVPNDFSQWGPRVGVAWNVRGGNHPTVVRAAWGLYYALTVGIFLPTAGAGNLTHCIGSCALPDGGLASFPYLNPNSTTLSVNELCGTEFGCAAPTSGGGYVDPQFQNPRVSSFTGGLEQTLPGNIVLTGTFSYVHSTHLRTGGYDSEEAWQRNYVVLGRDSFGRSILQDTFTYTNGMLSGQGPTPLDSTLPTATNETASFSYGNYESLVVNLTKHFSNHFQVFANYIFSQNKDNGASERDTDTYFGQQDPVNLKIDYFRNGLDIRNQFKAAGVYELPWGFEVSSSVITHTGVPFPLYIEQDINGDEVSDLGHNNDRPTFTNGNGKTHLLTRYPFDQPGYFEWDGRLQKDIHLRERLHVIASGDFFNITNYGNLYSNPNNPNTATISLNGCTPRFTPPATSSVSVVGPAGLICPALTPATMPVVGVNGFRAITQVAPGSTPFAFQAGVKFVF
jgi:Carboxypeptidase regulatory-like domain